MDNSAIKNWYNTVIPERDGEGAYEYDRWFKNPIQEAGYKLTRGAVRRHVLGDESLNPVRVLELGPGAGTWTKLLLARFPDAYFDLLDISEEMLARAKAALGAKEHIRYITSDVMQWTPEVKY